MELRRYFAVLSQRWLLIAVTVAAAVAAGYLATPKDLVYTARSTIVVGPRQFSTDPGSSDLSGDATFGLERLTKTYAVLIDSDPIARDAVERAGVDRSPDGVVAATTAVALSGTQLLVIEVADAEPSVARALANGIAEAFVAKVESFEAGAPATEGTVPELPVYIFEQAKMPTVPVGTNLESNLVVAGLFGLLAAVGLAVLLEYLDITIKSVEDAEHRLELPVLGAIPLLAQSGPIVAPAARRRRPSQVSPRSA
ncbi:YveK family protein [soil metagenome]